MRAVVQRVKEASVQVENQEVGSIGHGILVLLGVGRCNLYGRKGGPPENLR
jgi:D-tyrosyl-tRNA(Tyr) deacylase